MISPEVLRRYPFFGLLNDGQLKALALIAEAVTWEAGQCVFEFGDPADALYLLTEGAVDLYERSQDAHKPELRKEFLVGEVNPGELFGISALLPPFRLTATAVVTKPSNGIRFDAGKLYHLCQVEIDLENRILRQLTKEIFERLNYSRIQLAAARA